MKRLLIGLCAVTASLYGQSTVTLNGAAYTLKGHPRTLFDGPGGVLDLRIKDPDGPGPSVAPKAVNSNPAWIALKNAITAALPNYQTVSNRFNLRDGNAAMQFASYWYADNSQTAAHDAALYMLNHIEYYVPLVCVETAADCTGPAGYPLLTWGISYWIPNWIMAYELMRGEMTAQQRTIFADKMLNDNAHWGGIDGSPATSCTNGTVNSGLNVAITLQSWSVGAGTITGLTVSSNVVVQATIPTTAGLVVGQKIQAVGGADSGLGNNGYPILSIDSATQFSFGYTPSIPNGNRFGSNPSLVITYQVPFATTSGATFGTTTNPGDWIYTPTNTGNLGVVTTIMDSTHAYMAGGDISTVSSEAMYTLPQDWVPGQCGAAWVAKHFSWTAQPLAYSAGVTIYPPDGGSDGLDPGHNLIYSTLWGLQLIYLSTIDDDANASTRSGAELTAAYNWWFANSYTVAETLWTGFHQSGSGYGIDRATPFLAGTAVALQSSIVNPPVLLGGGWAKNNMQLYYANAFPGAQGYQMQWGQPDVSGAQTTAQNLQGFAMLAYWFRNTAEGAYANWWLQNLWAAPTGFGNAPGTNLGFTAANINGSSPAWFFIFTDQAYATTSLSEAPTTFAFNASDLGSAGQRADALISRTGYLSATDTLLDFHAETIPEYDHNVFSNQPSNYGSYKIVKGHYLLAEDYGIDFSNPAANGFTVGGTGSNYVEIGGTVDNVLTAPTPIHSSIPRAAGNNSYAYAMADVTQAYSAAVGLNHGYRHLVDFKKPGTQQMIVDYMDFQTTGGQMKRAYYHYPNKSTTSLAGDTVTSTNTNGNTSQLVTRVLSPQVLYIASDTSGSSFRLDVCPSLSGQSCDASNQSVEMIAVHMPATGLNNSLPNLALMPVVDPNFVGVEIDGSSPKIGVFSRKGETYTATSFTAAHAGTAQILIAGITPTAQNGNLYSLVKDGTPVLQHGTVGADATIYYEGTAGSYQVIAETAPPTISQATLPSGSQYQPYSQSPGLVGGSGSIVWTISSGSLPAGLTLDPSSGAIQGIPTSTGPNSFTIQVTDALGLSDSEPFTITIAAASPVQILTTSLGQPSVGVPYSQALAASGGGGFFTWSLLQGLPPSGLSLSSQGIVSGVPLFTGEAEMTVQAQDAFGNSATMSFRLNVNSLPVTLTHNIAVSGAIQLK